MTPSTSCPHGLYSVGSCSDCSVNGDPALRPQPSGETREVEPEGMSEDERRRWLAGRSDWREGDWEDHCGKPGCEECHGEPPWTYRRLPAPVASGGQHSSGEGESDLCRVEKAITAQPGVKKCIAHGDISVRQIANAVLRVMGARPAPVAETAGEAWGYVSRRIRIDGESCEGPWTSGKIGDGFYMLTVDDPNWETITLYASPVPAQDDDKLRRAVEELDAAYRRWVVEAGESNDVLQCVGPVIAALKSTAAKEGRE